MAENKYKQIRLNPDVRALLDDYKMTGESYSIAIGRLFKEMEYLKELNDEIRASRDSMTDGMGLSGYHFKPEVKEAINAYERDKNPSLNGLIEKYIEGVLYETGYYCITLDNDDDESSSAEGNKTPSKLIAFGKK